MASEVSRFYEGLDDAKAAALLEIQTRAAGEIRTHLAAVAKIPKPALSGGETMDSMDEDNKKGYEDKRRELGLKHVRKEMDWQKEIVNKELLGIMDARDFFMVLGREIEKEEEKKAQKALYPWIE